MFKIDLKTFAAASLLLAIVSPISGAMAAGEWSTIAFTKAAIIGFSMWLTGAVAFLKTALDKDGDGEITGSDFDLSTDELNAISRIDD